MYVGQKMKASYESERLEIHKITDRVYQHISFLQSETFGKVSCNGMIVLDGREAVIFDTPADDDAAVELINWVEKNKNCTIKAVIPTHFHDDCLGGLGAFHERSIPSYANTLTIELAEFNDALLPEHGFDKTLELQVGTKKVRAEFFGEGHTKDNIIGYFPNDKVIFGGCLIKEMKAGMGNLEDANVASWSQTVLNVKGKYPDTKVVIPGHGKTGGIELLDYTIELFK